MALYEVFSHSIKIKHKTTLCSKTSLFYILATALQFIFPILVAYYIQGKFKILITLSQLNKQKNVNDNFLPLQERRGKYLVLNRCFAAFTGIRLFGSFLKRTGTYREQPDVSFKHKMLLILETKFPEPLIFWSSYKKLNQMMSNRTLQLIPEIEHREVDVNRDGKKDEIQMSIDIPLTDQEIHSVKLILIFDYKLYLYSYFQMECAAFIYCSSALPGSALSVVGDLMLIQKQPLKHTGEDERYNIPVIDDKKDYFSSTNLKNVFLQYSRRNVTAILQNVYPDWIAVRATNQSFKISLVIHYPEQTILYKVGFWELFKWAFVQYVAIFAIFAYVFHRLKSYVFQKHLLPSIIIHPLKRDV